MFITSSILCYSEDRKKLVYKAKIRTDFTSEGNDWRTAKIHMAMPLDLPERHPDLNGSKLKFSSKRFKKQLAKTLVPEKRPPVRNKGGRSRP